MVEYKLVVKVKEIKGRCPVYKIGDTLVIEGPKINLNKTDAICIHALYSILHYSTALKKGVSLIELGLSKTEDKAYVQCLDPGEPYTSGGTVIFEIKREKQNKSQI